jgi:hypothetical protein
VLPRSEMVVPDAKIAVGDRGNLGIAQERKQYVTGPSLYAALADGLWSGMALHARHVAVWMDIVPYDGHLVMSTLDRSGVQVSSKPTEFAASIFWAGSTSDLKTMDTFLGKKVLNHMKGLCKKGSLTIPDAPSLVDLHLPAAGSRTSPSYNECDYKITKPVADLSLPLRKTFVDKWLAPGVPQKFKDLAQAEILKHDKEFNKSGIPWVLEDTQSGNTL